MLRVGTQLLALAVLVVSAAGQLREDEEKPLTIDEIVLLLQVDVEEARIVGHGDLRGWPDAVTDADVRRVTEAGAGPALRGRLLARLEGRGEIERLAKLYQTYDGRIDGKRGFSLLVPRGWVTEEPSKDGRRHAWHEHDLDGWFRRTSVFLWFLDLGPWEDQNAPALARIVFDAVKERLAASGKLPGEPSDGVIHDPDGADFRFVYAIFTDTKTKDRGVVGLALRLDAEKGLISVLGFSTHLGAESKRAPREILADMLPSLKLS